MIEPMYRVEMAPIEVLNKENGGRSIKFPVEGRVLENYRGVHIGQFWLGSDGLQIAVFIRKGSSGRTVKADRLDPAIHAIWQEYFKSLTFWEKWVRRLYAHRAWLATLIVGLVSASIVLSIENLLG